MQEFITNFFTYVNLLTGGNEFLTTAIIGGATVAMRKVPYRCYGFIRHRLRYVVTYDTSADDYKGCGYTTRLARDLASTHGSSRLNRFYHVTGYNGARNVFRLGIGNGATYCIYQRRLFLIKMMDMPSEGVDGQKYRYTFIYYGFSKKPLLNFLDSLEKEEDKQHHYVSGICAYTKMKKLTFDDIVMAEHDRLFFMQQIKSFKERREFAIEKNLDHKLIIVLPGEPGTGKTTIGKIIAAELDRNLMIVDPKNDPDRITTHDIKKNVILFEDIHAHANFLKTEIKEKLMATATIGGGEAMSLDKMLNLLQPIAPARDLVVILTANDLDKLHSALLRPGRITAIHEMSRIQPDMVLKDLHRCFDAEELNAVITTPWRGCDIAYFKECYFSNNYKAQDLVRYIESNIPELPKTNIKNLSDYMLECGEDTQYKPLNLGCGH